MGSDYVNGDIFIDLRFLEYSIVRRGSQLFGDILDQGILQDDFQVLVLVDK